MWVTADVMSLYTVIPHDLAILALDWFLCTYSKYSVNIYRLFTDNRSFDGCEVLSITGKYLYGMVGEQVPI